MIWIMDQNPAVYEIMIYAYLIRRVRVPCELREVGIGRIGIGTQQLLQIVQSKREPD